MPDDIVTRLNEAATAWEGWAPTGKMLLEAAAAIEGLREERDKTMRIYGEVNVTAKCGRCGHEMTIPTACGFCPKCGAISFLDGTWMENPLRNERDYALVVSATARDYAHEEHERAESAERDLSAEQRKARGLVEALGQVVNAITAIRQDIGTQYPELAEAWFMARAALAAYAKSEPAEPQGDAPNWMCPNCKFRGHDPFSPPEDHARTCCPKCGHALEPILAEPQAE